MASTMGSRLVDSLCTTDALADLFADASVLQAMLDVEAALAGAAAASGAIPDEAARVISGACRAEDFDAVAIAQEARESGTPVIPLVEALTARVASASPEHAQHVHWGATSQDVSDSAMVLLLRRARPSLARDHSRLARGLRELSDRHADAVMLGRTLLQPATPITFGLKVAGWFAAISRAWARLDRAWEAALVLQFGGASGTRAAAGGHAAAMASAMSSALGLQDGPPWHTDRDRLGALVSACGLYTAALGKVARDISLLMQHEVAEAAEPGGGSSTMPHKRNPAKCAAVLAGATRMPGLVASFLSGMLQEHERSLGGWHAEWPTIAASVQTTGAAVAALADAVAGLSVDPARMRQNLGSTRGLIFAERAVMLLTPHVGRDGAQALVAEAVRACAEPGITFGQALERIPAVSAVLSPAVLREIDRPENYIGQADALRSASLAGPAVDEKE